MRLGCAVCVCAAPSAGAGGDGGVGGDDQGRALGPGGLVLLAQLLRQLPHALQSSTSLFGFGALEAYWQAPRLEDASFGRCRPG